MDTRKLLSTTALYGVADVIVLAVGGFLLLPLYTRALSQAEFGTYVIVRTNIEIFTYALYLGLPSAVARVYFDHKQRNQHVEYLTSILMFFLISFLVFCAVLSIWGVQLWALLSPATPASPYLGFTLTISAVGFFGALGSIWLRMEGRALAFAALQLATSIVLASAAIINLLWLDMGLRGLLIALVISSACSALSLPWLFEWRFRPAIRWSHVTESLHYAVPILIGYVAYFVLNRIGTVILQHHVAVDQIAIFGLAQQLALSVTIAAAAFGKASQPAVFAAPPAQAAELMRRSGRLLMLLMLCITSALVLFAPDLFALVAPSSYGSGSEILLILLVASFAYSFTHTSNTAMLYHRRPKTSVSVSIIGAALSASLGFLLIPPYHLYGAAMAIAGGFFTMTFLSHWIARRLTGHSDLAPMLLALATVCSLAVFSAWLQRQGLQESTLLGLRLGIGALVLSSIYLLSARKAATKPCAL